MPFLRHILIGLSACSLLLCAVSAAQPAATAELHVRDGLPNLALRGAANSGELRVAYLGGSITAAPGWRSLTTAYLQTRYPKLKIIEIAASLPGTGSDLGAFRVGRDALAQHPDLIFVEFAVNDFGTPPARIERTMEGIVRQTWRANPHTDICFVYTLSAPGLPDLQAGKFTAAAQAMETVAAHYGIPSIQFGLEVARRVTAGSLVFKAPAKDAAPTSAVATSDEQTFSLDGVHPTAAGHRIYADIVERSLPLLLKSPGPPVHPLFPPLHPDNWEYATLCLLDTVTRKGDWTLLAPNDPNLRGATSHLLPPTWRSAAPGSSLEFEFHGTRLGLLGIAAPDSGQFRVTVDDLPPVTDTFFDSYVTPTFCRQRSWFFPAELSNGPHRVQIELLDTVVDKTAIKTRAGKSIDNPAAYAPQRLTLCGLLILGSPMP